MAGNNLFEKYLSFAEERAEKFAKTYGLDEEDVKQDARITLFLASEKCDLNVYEFEKYLNSALSRSFNRQRPTYSSVRYPDYIASHIHYIAKVFDFDKSLESNLKRVQRGLKIKKAEAMKKIEYFLTIHSVNNGESLDFSDFEDACLIEETEQAFTDFFNNLDKEEVRRIINEVCFAKEADVIFRNLGFFGYEEDFTKISWDYGISKQRVGELYKQGIEKLSKPHNIRKLMAVLENR